jgi:uncharacterized protein (DUF1697 family)
MNSYIALFRGINVGGKNILPMKQLVVILAGLGLENVKSYIQSGNAIFCCKAETAAGLPARIRAAIAEHAGFEPRVILLELAEMERAIGANPFPDAETDPKTLHLYFLAAEPDNPDIALLENLRQGKERYVLADQVFYLHAPNGIGRSKLAAQAEKALGVAVTARNWRSVTKIVAMARDIDGK